MKHPVAGKLLLASALLLFFNSPGICGDIGNNSFAQVTLHYTISAGITFAACRIVSHTHPDMSLTHKYMISSGFALMVGVAKEVFDLATGNFIDPVDLGFDLLGIGTGLVLHYLLFDKKAGRTNLSLQLTNDHFLATLRINLNF